MATTPPNATTESPISVLTQPFHRAANSLVAGLAETARLAKARAFAHAVVNLLWLQRAPRALECLPAPLPVEVLSPEERACAADLVGNAASLSMPLAAHVLSTVYARMLPELTRRAEGAFYTPPHIASRLIDLAVDAGVDLLRARVVDPAAGAGGILVPLLGRIAAALRCHGATPDEILDSVIERIRGVEVDPVSAWMSHVFLELQLSGEVLSTGRRLPRIVTATDAFAAPSPFTGGADLVIGNPPFGRMSISPDLRRRFAHVLDGHAHSYALFMDLALDWAARDGVIALITPTSFLGGKYFCRLRESLRERARPASVDFLRERSGVFDGAVQETALTVLRSRTSSAVVEKEESVCIRAIGSDGDRDVITVGAFALPTEPSAPWLLPRSPVQATLVRAAQPLTWRLRDFGVSVHTGPFLWDRHKTSLAGAAGPNRYPVVWGESVLPGGRFTAERRRRQRGFVEIPSDQRHLIIDRPCVLVQRTTAPEQPRRLVAAKLPQEMISEHGGVAIENHLNMVMPRIPAPGNCDREVGHGASRTISLEALVALLNSDPLDHLFRCMSGSVAVSAYELLALPLPCPAAMTELERLVAAGAVQKEIDQFLYSAYLGGEELLAA